jgi:hypothetical protein
METYRITFMPDEKSVEVEADTALTEKEFTPGPVTIVKRFGGPSMPWML